MIAVNDWDEDVLILELRDEPDFSEDTDGTLTRLRGNEVLAPDIIVDLQAVTRLNSSNLGAIIEIRKVLRERDRRLLVCNLSDGLWSTMLATGLDQVFEFTEDVTTALASLMVGE